MSATVRGRLVPTFDSRRCKQCGLCVHLCPVDALEPLVRSAPALVHPDACTSCRTCELICPDFAVSMISRDGGEPGIPTWVEGGR